MLHLRSDTSPDWAARVLRDLDTVLLDHAHCEKKAASTAISLMFRHQERAGWMVPLSEVAREELEHFERCLALLSRRGIAFERLVPSPYAERLHAQVRRHDPGRGIDNLLCCALIEARSCERMKRLAEALPDPELAAFYRELLASEARHHALYVDFALELGPRAEVLDRLAALAEHEAAVLATCPEESHLHSAGIS